MSHVTKVEFGEWDWKPVAKLPPADDVWSEWVPYSDDQQDRIVLSAMSLGGLSAISADARVRAVCVCGWQTTARPVTVEQIEKVTDAATFHRITQGVVDG